MDILSQQDELQREARGVIEKLKLADFLGKFGQVKIVGSVALGLMTWRDVDIEVVCVNVKNDDLLKTAKYLLGQSGVLQITLEDHIKRIDDNKPKGLYAGAKYQESNAQVWKIDVWFKNQVADDEWIMSKLTDETRLVILAIKSRIDSDPTYRRSVFSTDIYKAVLERNVRDLKEFKNYLKESGRSLSSD